MSGNNPVDHSFSVFPMPFGCIRFVTLDEKIPTHFVEDGKSGCVIISRNIF